jgi:hypothetical protein
MGRFGLTPLSTRRVRRFAHYRAYAIGASSLIPQLELDRVGEASLGVDRSIHRVARLDPEEAEMTSRTRSITPALPALVEAITVGNCLLNRGKPTLARIEFRTLRALLVERALSRHIFTTDVDNAVGDAGNLLRSGGDAEAGGAIDLALDLIVIQARGVLFRRDEATAFQEVRTVGGFQDDFVHMVPSMAYEMTHHPRQHGDGVCSTHYRSGGVEKVLWKRERRYL